jgi:hypothetical protein
MFRLCSLNKYLSSTAAHPISHRFYRNDLDACVNESEVAENSHLGYASFFAIPLREFSKGRRTILLIRSGVSADRRKCSR